MRGRGRRDGRGGAPLPGRGGAEASGWGAGGGAEASGWSSAGSAEASAWGAPAPHGEMPPSAVRAERGVPGQEPRPIAGEWASPARDAAASGYAPPPAAGQAAPAAGAPELSAASRPAPAALPAGPSALAAPAASEPSTTPARTGRRFGRTERPARREWVVARLHSHARGLVLPCLVLIAAGGFIGYSTRGLREGGMWATWAVLAGLAALLLGVVPILAWLRNRVVITTTESRRHRGLVRSTRVALPHHHVADVAMRRNAWQALFGSGTIVLTGLDGRRLELPDVPNAVTVAQALRELTGIPDR